MIYSKRVHSMLPCITDGPRMIKKIKRETVFARLRNKLNLVTYNNHLPV
uniref:Uncharacterized protein n=1 Tax=Arundo donax TaxID=35708 RepID=A0A0A9AGE3_ARUDO